MVSFIANNDPRRLEMAAFAIGAEQNLLVQAIDFDNELWAIAKNAKEPMMARIRMQYYIDEIERVKTNGKSTIPISEFFKQLKSLEHVENLIWAHVEKLENPNKNPANEKIWENYFNLAQEITIQKIDFDISKICAQIINSANLGDFTFYGKNIKTLNSKLYVFSKEIRQKLLPAIGFVKLAKNQKLYENIIEKRLGIRAKLALFGVILFGRI